MFPDLCPEKLGLMPVDALFWAAEACQPLSCSLWASQSRSAWITCRALNISEKGHSLMLDRSDYWGFKANDDWADRRFEQALSWVVRDVASNREDCARPFLTVHAWLSCVSQRCLVAWTMHRTSPVCLGVVRTVFSCSADLWPFWCASLQTELNGSMKISQCLRTWFPREMRCSREGPGGPSFFVLRDNV